MMKIDRYKMHPRFDAVELVIDPDGSVCYTRDVAKLEALNAELLEALETLSRDVLGGCICYDEPERERIAWAKADAAIAKAKGEAP